MTNEDIQSELDRRIFRPFRLHLASGKTIVVTMANAAWMLRNGILVLHDPTGADDDAGYDIVALRNIERLEQL